MGVTDIYSVTVDGVKNFKSAIEKEETARQEWSNRWEWMTEYYREMHDKLHKLIEKRSKSEETSKEKKKRKKKKSKKKEKIPSLRRCSLPIPESTGHEYGWLASKPEFMLERPKRSLKMLPLEVLELNEDLLIRLTESKRKSKKQNSFD